MSFWYLVISTSEEKGLVADPGKKTSVFSDLVVWVCWVKVVAKRMLNQKPVCNLLITVHYQSNLYRLDGCLQLAWKMQICLQTLDN